MNTTGDAYSKGNSCQVNNTLELCEVYLPGLNDRDVILDLGCGTGEVTKYLARKYGAKATGLDSNSDMVEYARKKNSGENICYETVDLQQLEWFLKPEKKTCMTAAVSSNVFHWIMNLKAALQNIYNVPSPGGRLLVNHPFKPKNGHWMILPKLTSKQKWKTLLDKSNFSWDSPYHRALYEDGVYEWLNSTSAIEELVTSVGFSVGSIKIYRLYLECKQDTFRPILPVLPYLPKERHEEFIQEFLDGKKIVETDMVTYVLTKEGSNNH